jgi:hypothetical protein
LTSQACYESHSQDQDGILAAVSNMTFVSDLLSHHDVVASTKQSNKEREKESLVIRPRRAMTRIY